MKRFFSHYFPKKEALKSEIFKKILLSFLYIVVILFLVFSVYFYFRIYRKEVFDFEKRIERHSIFTSKLLEDSLFEVAQDAYYLKNDPLFLEVFSSSPNTFPDSLTSFFKKRGTFFRDKILFEDLIIQKEEKIVLIYDFDNKDFRKSKNIDIKDIKKGIVEEKDGISLIYPKNCKKNRGSIFYYFSIKGYDIYLRLTLKRLIHFLLRYKNYFEGVEFIFTRDGNLVYVSNQKIGEATWKKIKNGVKSSSGSIKLEKSSLSLIAYVPFRARPFRTSFVLVKVIPIYVVFKTSEYNVVVLTLFIITILLSFIFSNLILKQIIVPLQILKETVVKVAQGDFRGSVKLQTGDEFEELANAVNVMIRRIEDLYTNLEEKVKERTEELERQKYRLKKLYELSFIFFKDKDEMLQTLLLSLIEVLDVEIVSVSYKTDEEWRFLSFVDRENKAVHEPREPVNKDLKFDDVVYSTQKSLIISDTLADEKWRWLFAETQIRSYMGVPIFVNGNIYGVLSVINRFPYEFSSQDLEVVSLFSQRISYFLETELWEKRIIEKQKELEELNNLLYMKNLELIKLAEDLKRANKAKSDFLANVSHELRTPLNAILGFSEVLLEGYFGELNDKQKEYVKDILESGRHLLDLINDILDLSKIEAGKEELHLVRVDLLKIIEASLILIKEKALKHAIEVKVYHDERIKEIVVDELKLKQVLFNLLSNAIKFTPDGGKIGIVTRELDNWYRISVWDTGIGIKKEDMKKLFKEFSQVENPYTKRYKGTGLGLALSKRLIEMHGGFIKVVSVYKKGTTFSVFIPKNLKESVGEDEKDTGGGR